MDVESRGDLMISNKAYEGFCKVIEDIIDEEKVQKMNGIYHHVDGVSCLDHSISVAYVSYLVCKKLHLNASAAARGGLLHDLYLCNWKETNTKQFKRLCLHPQMALENAKEYNLSKKEKDIIGNHMWPITLTKLPKCRESIVVCAVDKICALSEQTGIYWYIRVNDALRSLNKSIA